MKKKTCHVHQAYITQLETKLAETVKVRDAYHASLLREKEATAKMRALLIGVVEHDCYNPGLPIRRHVKYGDPELGMCECSRLKPIIYFLGPASALTPTKASSVFTEGAN